ncbi:MAG: adenylyltransferase/cytidyltransferase family protein [Pseudomonadota bacterium]|jgi:rfaE bifunctional protein nucleotidyltransferase chain/domain
MSLEKIHADPDRLVAELRRRRQAGERIVFANGCFELLHVGHVRFLAGARELGDLLIVAVNTDVSMRIIKPDRRPVNPDYERMELIAAFECVDYVVPLREVTPHRLIELYRPDVHTKGTDYTLDRIPERETVERYGGRVALVGDPKSHSTTEMLRRLREGCAPAPAAASGEELPITGSSR